MDNSNPAPQTPTANTPPEPSIPTPIVPEESNNMVVWLVVGLVGIIVIVGVIYFLLSSRQAAINTSKTEQPVVQVSPEPPDTVDALERDLNALEVSDSDSDFTSIDQDLEQL